MMKIDYVIRSCIYNRICVVGKKEIIYPLVQTVNALYLQLLLYLIQFHLLMKSMISFASFIRMHLLFYYASGSNHRSKPRIYHMLYSLWFCLFFCCVAMSYRPYKHIIYYFRSVTSFRSRSNTMYILCLHFFQNI